MNKIIAAIAVICLSMAATAQKQLINDADAEVRQISGSFTKIKISGGIDLFLSQDVAEAVAISASDSKTKEAIKTEIVNGTLKIYFDGDKNWSWKNRKMRAYVSFKTLEELTASGACDVQVAGTISGSSFSMTMSGASDFKGMVNVTSLKMELSGASDAKIGGTATTVNIESSGASDVKGYDLITDVCTAKASGASDINITVNKELNAHASGASDIFYKGNAVIKDMHSSGASSIEKKS